MSNLTKSENYAVDHSETFFNEDGLGSSSTYDEIKKAYEAGESEPKSILMEVKEWVDQGNHIDLKLEEKINQYLST
jgi:hypothetical protein